MIIAAATASTAEEAPRRWPVIDLSDTTGTLRARRPRTDLIAAVSMRSFSRDEVPWAMTQSTSRGLAPASARAERIAAAAPVPPGAGRV